MRRVRTRWGGSLPALSATLLAWAALGATGCAQIRPAVASAPTYSTEDTSPGLGSVSASTAGEPTDVEPIEAELGYGDPEGGLGWHEPEGGAEEEEEAEELEDDHDELVESPDIMACLDRGPSSPPNCPQFQVSSPLMGLGDAEIQRRVKSDLGSLGAVSIGAPNRGRLINGVQLPKSDRYKQTDPGNAWGTEETIGSIIRAVDKVHLKFPGSRPVMVGHISARGGGHLRPHKSHQAGRDVDLSYFYNGEKGWYAVATDKNLDKARSWAFVKAFIEDPNVEMILVDTSVQRLLRDHALRNGEDPAFIDRVFQVSGKSPRPIVRHVRGHATHIHVRFYSPNAQATAHIAAAYLPKPPPVAPPRERVAAKHRAQAKHGPDAKDVEEEFFFHRARSGDTLDSLARRYGVTVKAIKDANGLKTNSLKEKKAYRIPKAKKKGPTASSTNIAKPRQR